MKKITKIGLLLIALIISMTINVFAADFSVKPEIQKQDEGYLLKISLDELNFSGAGMNAFICDIGYDRNVFEELKQEDIEVKNNWGDLTFNNKTGTVLVLRSDFTKQSGEEILEVKLTPKVKSANTEIKLSNIQASNSQNDLEADEQIVNLKVNSKGSVWKGILIGICIFLLIIVVIRFISKSNVKRRRKR